MSQVFCNCKDIDFGSYSVVVDIFPPWDSNKFISIDKCILKAVTKLWAYGIETTNSCCGHNKHRPTVCVIKEHEASMHLLGYESIKNEFGVLEFLL